MSLPLPASSISIASGSASASPAAFKQIMGLGTLLVGFHFALLTFVTQYVQSCQQGQCQYGHDVPIAVVYAIALLFTTFAIPSLQIAWHTITTPSAAAGITLQDQVDRNYHTRFRLCFIGLNAASFFTITNVVVVAFSIAPLWLGVITGVVFGAHGIILIAYTVRVVTNSESFAVLQGLGAKAVKVLQEIIDNPWTMPPVRWLGRILRGFESFSCGRLAFIPEAFHCIS
ncbi:hypothetical protein HGRIS_011662 [Hohenbuehelia grisea]|uniref:Uncharacterized protein n=1 Tax=Hohenbuehelia grisea TaxID=104357 RepID=A0ABR3JY15_9AGAR